MKRALIGYTGFVGSTLLRQTSFDDLYNSSNIADIRGKDYDLIVCAGAPAVKWRANLEPANDWANLQKLIGHLTNVSTKSFLLISTVDVYPDPQCVYEDSLIDSSKAEPYGRHRYQLECFAREKFARCSVVRLPGLFGEGLKKNFIYDLMHSNCLHLTNAASWFQFYDLSCLWTDLQAVIHYNLPTVNFGTEPVSARSVAVQCFGIDFVNTTEKPPVRYDMRTKYAALFDATGDYLYSAEETFERINDFLATRQAVVQA